MAKRRTIKKKTYKEFMAWLEGVECMQEDDWTPNDAQWKTIREMLAHLQPEVKTVEKTVEVNTPVAAPAGYRGPIAEPGQPVAQLVDVNNAPVPRQESAFRPAPTNSHQPQRLMPSALQEQAPVAPGVPAATSTKKDQILDTSDGNYQSEFM